MINNLNENLLNRNYLHQIYHTKLSASINKSSFLAVLLCDIDHFKHVNDTFGHDTGDKVLKNIAEKDVKFFSAIIMLSHN